MSLRFSYVPVRVAHPVASLGGRWVRPRPLINVTLIGPAKSWTAQAILDPATDDTVFPESAATLAGIDLSGAPTGTAAGVGMANVPVRFADVLLRTTDGRERREWPATVGFTPARLRYPLLGFAGFLQFFEVMFWGDREEVQLTVNSLYPGT